MNVLTSSPSAQSLGGASRFARGGDAHEESRQLRASLAALAECLEAAARTRRLRLDTAAINRMAVTLVQGVREHQWFLTGMGSAWYGLYGFAAYRGAVAQLLRATQAWQQQLEQRSQGEGAAFDRAELLAWRTLGKALLLIDLYEQDGSSRSAAISGTTSAAHRVPVWWRALHKWPWR